MTKNGKITAGIVAGVVVLGGIGALTNTDKDTPNLLLDNETSTSAIIEETTEKTTITTTAKEIETTVEETTVIITTVEEITTTEKEVPTTKATEIQTEVSSANSNGNGNNFNTYDNSEQQNTTEYVLNTSTLKIHRSSCKDVKKIAPENYSTTTDFDKAISNGYTTCGHCF